jgi:hypothetical protein
MYDEDKKDGLGEGNEQENERDAILMSEADIIAGFLDAVSDKDKVTKIIEIARPDPKDKDKKKIYFRFEITGLDEEVYNRARQQATTYKKNRQLGGIKMPDETNTTEYRSRLIFEATVPDPKLDNKKIWDCVGIKKALEAKHGMLAGFEVVEKALMAGEKEAVVQIIDQLSGYDTEVEDAIKK